MELTPKAIADFKRIYYEECGEQLTDKKAVELATAFFTLMAAVYRPIPKESCELEKNMVT